MKHSKIICLSFTLSVLFISQSLFSQSNDHKIDSITFRNLIYSHQFKTDTVSSKQMAALIEKLLQLNFISATVRFSEAGFPDVVSVPLTNRGMEGTTPWLNRCKAGSKITFEKSILKKSDGTSSFPINKSIYIQ